MTGVETTAGRIEAPVVVIVARRLVHRRCSRRSASTTASRPHRIQVSIFRWPAGFTQRHPVVIDAIHKAWMRPEGRASTLIGVELGVAHGDPEKFDEGVDADYVARCRADARGPLASPSRRRRCAAAGRA